MSTIKELSTMWKMEERVRLEPLLKRIEVCESIVSNLCDNGRHIKMSIPVSENDEDLMLSVTLQDCRKRILELERELVLLRMDSVECHIERDILDTLSEAMNILPLCGTLSILSGASQEIQALRINQKENGNV